MRKVNTVRFGAIEIDESKVVRFEQGIPAFEDEHEFLIIPYDETSPYVFLQSLSTPDLAFLMTMPFIFFPEYEFEVDDDSLARLGIKGQDDLLIYVLLTLPGGKVQEMTANLMAPVIINTTNMQARQIVLDKSRYNTKHRLFPEKKEGE
ncbi:MAG: flagellar assembly protein FliW [Selenomonadaceae bacterium]|nr:flagellar assembly protein FliW [Selenomonadaceae bacterium]MBR4695846.1 flagellar assembly protein FliW [Selenomonadaceae bacterium]